MRRRLEDRQILFVTLNKPAWTVPGSPRLCLGRHRRSTLRRCRVGDGLRQGDRRPTPIVQSRRTR